MLKLKCTKVDFGWGSAPDPLAGFKGPTSKGRGGEGTERKGRGREGREGKGRGFPQLTEFPPPEAGGTRINTDRRLLSSIYFDHSNLFTTLNSLNDSS